MRLATALLALGLLGGACTSESGSAVTRTRIPDVEGIVTDISLERVQIDGEQTYPFVTEVESFKTRSHEVTSLLTWDEKYVHVGLNDADEVVWIAGIGVVRQGDDPTVLYSGVFQGSDADTGRAVFEDGTTLALADGVELPEEGTEVVATLDPEQDVVTDLRR